MIWFIPFAALLLILLPGAFFYFLALRRKPIKKGGHGGTPAGPASFRADRDWLREAPQQDVFLTSRDGLRLRARLILQGDGERFAILCHGYKAHSASLAHYARKYHERGFSLLMPDARAHGESGGRVIGMGWPERLDLLEWISLLNARFGRPDILLMGVSMGGATVMNACGEQLPDNVRAAIEDCGFCSIRQEFVHQLHCRHLPAWPFLPGGDLLCRLLGGYSILRDGDSCAQLARSSIPMLFIHGGADRFVPPEMTERAFSAKPGGKHRLVVPGAGHADSALTDPERYWAAVDAFLSHSFPSRT